MVLKLVLVALCVISGNGQLQKGYYGTSTFSPNSDKLVLKPDRGNMLGGTLVNVSGPVFDNVVRLLFDDTVVQCAYVNSSVAQCSTPSIFTSGYVKVSYYDQQSRTTFTTAFYIENPLTSQQDVWFQNNAFDNMNSGLRLFWNSSYFPTVWRYSVVVKLYGYREFGNTTELRLLQTLDTGTPNDGFQDYSNFIVTAQDFKVGVFQVSYNYASLLTPILWSRPVPLVWLIYKKWWSGNFAANGKDLCNDWTAQDKALGNFTAGLTACPCTLAEAKGQSDKYVVDLECDQWYNSRCYGNKKATSCLITRYPTDAGAAQQCCYNSEGNIVTNDEDRKTGFPSRAHPLGMKPYNVFGRVPGFSYMEHDMVPYLFCCKWQKLDDTACYTYKERRPPSNCLRYPYPI